MRDQRSGVPHFYADMEIIPELFKNFRSRDNVLDFTNLIFKDIMSQKLGEVDYTEDEYLNFGAEDYKKINQKK